jgi:ABC-2 type transport system permease protein
MNFFSLMVNEATLLYHELKQYWFETVFGVVMITGMFCALFFGIQFYASDEGTTTSLDGLVFGFLLWSFASGAYISVSQSISEDNQKGFLEQLFLCPAGFSRLMLARALVEMVWGIVLLTLIAWITMAVTGNWLKLNFFYFYLLLLIASFSLVGVGFIISGLALVYKKVGSAAMLVNIGLMAVVAVSALPFNVYTLLPFAAGASLAKIVILQGEPLNLLHLGIVVINSLVYLCSGLFIFKKLEARAKRLNLIGQY